MSLLAKLTGFSTQSPRLSSQGPALASPEARVGCEIVHEGESPLKAEYVLSFYYGSTLNINW